MAITDWIKRLMGRGVNSMSTFNVGNMEVYTPISTQTAISEGYNGNSAVYAILNKDSQKFGSIPTYLMKEDGEEEVEIENDLTNLLYKPNEYQGQDSFRALLRTYYKLTGEAFIWLNRGDLSDLVGRERLKKPVFEMYVLPSDFVSLIPDPTNVWGCIGYILNLSGQQIRIQKEDVIHWKNQSLDFDAVSRQHLRGRSPLASGYKTLQQNNDATSASVRMYQNDGAKGILYSETPGDYTPDQKAQLDGVIARKINNYDVKGAVARLAGKWGYLDLGRSNTDLGLLEGKDASMKELCFLFDVPYTLFDPNSSFSNTEWQQKNWITNSIIPACKQFDDELNRILPIAFGLDKTYKIESDFSELPEMQEDYAKMVTSLAQAWWLTPNEKRDWMGEEPLNLPEFDEPMIPGGIQPLSMIGESMDSIANNLTQMGLNDQSGNQ